jgi:hypothetical protein
MQSMLCAIAQAVQEINVINAASCSMPIACANFSDPCASAVCAPVNPACPATGITMTTDGCCKTCGDVVRVRGGGGGGGATMTSRAQCAGTVCANVTCVIPETPVKTVFANDPKCV